MKTVQQSYTIKTYFHQIKPKKSFRTILLEAVDEGLSLLGDSAKHSLYYHLQRSYGIEKNEIPDKIEEFENALNDIFGFGSKIILIKIMEKLHKKVDFEIKITNGEELKFTEYVKAVAYSLSSHK